MWDKVIDKRELVRFLVGGSSAVITDFVIYNLLLWFTMAVPPSKLIAFVSGSLVGFVINKFWTFESKGMLSHEIFKYAILYTISCGLNVLVNSMILGWGAPRWLAFLFATGSSTVVNFLGQKFFVFRK